MFTNHNLRTSLFLFLALAVLSSKNIFIYNEETLVALSFFCFVYFVLYYFGTVIQNALDERSHHIREKLQNLVVLKQLSFQDLLIQHKKTAELGKAVDILDNFTQTQVHLLQTQGEKAFKNMWNEKIETKLKALVFSKIMKQQSLEESLSEKTHSNVLVAFPQKGKQLQNYKKIKIKKSVSSLVANRQKR